MMDTDTGFMYFADDLERIADEMRRAGQTIPQKNLPRSWRQHVFTAARIKGKKIVPVSPLLSWVIPGGLTILPGRPTVGQSWMALDIALAKAGGRFVLGDIHLIEGDVLYAALEDNDRRLRSRIERILTQQAQTWPSRLTLATRWRRLDQGGVADAKEWAASV